MIYRTTQRSIPVRFGFSPTLLPFGKAGGLRIRRCQGFATTYNGHSLGTLTLKPSNYCNIEATKLADLPENRGFSCCAGTSWFFVTAFSVFQAAIPYVNNALRIGRAGGAVRHHDHSGSSVL